MVAPLFSLLPRSDVFPRLGSLFVRVFGTPRFATLTLLYTAPHCFFRVQARAEGGGGTGTGTGTGAGNQKKKSKNGGAGSAAASNDHGGGGGGGGGGSGGKSRDEPSASGAGRDDDQGSDLLATTRSMEKQLKNQRRKWPKGHVRQILRCRQNLIARVIGTKGVTLRSIEVSQPGMSAPK